MQVVLYDDGMMCYISRNYAMPYALSFDPRLLLALLFSLERSSQPQLSRLLPLATWWRLLDSPLFSCR